MDDKTFDPIATTLRQCRPAVDSFEHSTWKDLVQSIAIAIDDSTLDFRYKRFLKKAGAK